MLTPLRLSKAMGRLLTAALLCLSVVLSQIAHAEMPAPSAVQPTVAEHSVGEDAGRDHHGVVEEGEKEGGCQGNGDVGTGKCAMYCSSAFVAPAGLGTVRLDGVRQVADMSASRLVGSPPARSERPPRA